MGVMPMRYSTPARKLAPTAPPNLATWPFEDPETVDRQTADVPKAAERLYTPDGRLVVSAGHALPEGWELLLTERQVIGEPAPARDGDVYRRRVRRL